MNIDDAGHKFGLDSRQYRNSARHADVILANYLQGWIDDGYQVMVTSDHGMNNDLSHGGILAEERQVPLFVIGEHFSHHVDVTLAQTEICGTVCELLRLEHDKPVAQQVLAL